MKPQATMKRRVAVSAIAQIASQAAMAIIGIVILKIMTNYLGVEGYGVYATILAFVSTFALLTDLGLNAITGREIAKHPDKADEIIGYNMGLRIALCLVMIPVISGLGFVFYPDATEQLRAGILILSAYLFFDSIRSVSLAYFTAKVRNDISALVNTSQQVVFLAVVGLVAAAGFGLFGFLAGYVAANVLSAILAVVLVRGRVTVRPRADIRRWKAIFALSLSLGIIQVINMMYLKADTVLLSLLDGPEAVGLYQVAYSLIIALLSISSFIMTALIPSLATATPDMVRRIVHKAFQYMVILACLLAVGGFVVREDIVVAISSEAFAAAATPFAILALASAFSYLNNVFGFASVSLNKHHKMVYVSLGALLLNICLNILLIPHYSITGAAAATAVSEFASLVGVYLIFRHATGVRMPFAALAYKPVIAAVGALCVSLWLAPVLWSTGNVLVNTALAAGTICGLYGGVLWLLKGLPAEVTAMLQAVTHKLWPRRP